MELCIQLSIIMLGKQLIQNNLFEIGIPYVSQPSPLPCIIPDTVNQSLLPYSTEWDFCH